MIITIDTLKLSPQCVVALANAISAEITEFHNESGCGSSLDEESYIAVDEELSGLFDVLCEAVKQHGLELSDHVVCPED